VMVVAFLAKSGSAKMTLRFASNMLTDGKARSSGTSAPHNHQDATAQCN